MIDEWKIDECVEEELRDENWRRWMNKKGG